MEQNPTPKSGFEPKTLAYECQVRIPLRHFDSLYVATEVRPVIFLHAV